MARSVTPESSRRSAVAISHSRRSAASIARAGRLRRRGSSSRRTPHTAWKLRDHPRRQEHRLAAGQLGVVHLAAPEQVVLQPPRQRRLVIGLRVARHHGVAPAADRHVQRRSGPPAIGETGGEPHLLDEVLGGEHRVHLAGALAAPADVAELLDVVGNAGARRHGFDCRNAHQDAGHGLRPGRDAGATLAPMRSRREILRLGAAAVGVLAAPRGAAAQKSRRILLLGGTGFIGPHLVHAALARGHHVSMLNRGRRTPNQNAGDFARVEALRGDRSQPDAYASLKGQTWDAVIDTATNLRWTREAVAALERRDRPLHVRVVDRRVPAVSHRRHRRGRPGPAHRRSPAGSAQLRRAEGAERADSCARAFRRGISIVRPGYIVGPGDTSDRFTYWPVRIARGGEVLVPGRKSDFVQYIDVRDLAAWMIGLVDGDASGTFNAVGPPCRRPWRSSSRGCGRWRPAPLSFTWIEDYEWLKAYPLRQPTPGDTTGLTYAIPWVMAEGDELGHVRISNRKALAAGLTCRPLLDTARDTLAWRRSDAVPARCARRLATSCRRRRKRRCWRRGKSEKRRNRTRQRPPSPGSTARDLGPGPLPALHRPAEFCRIAAVAHGPITWSGRPRPGPVPLPMVRGSETCSDTDVAVVGMAGRFPGARTPARLLGQHRGRRGVDSSPPGRPTAPRRRSGVAAG